MEWPVTHSKQPPVNIQPTVQTPSEIQSSVFRVGAKTFNLSFDGGRAAPYLIKERRGRFQGSLWLNLLGLKWLLGVMEEVRIKENKKGFFQFLRSNYSTLEVSCLMNKGGRFLEIAEYHGGAQKGSLRVPEGPRGTGWRKLALEIGSFFLGRKEVKLAPIKPVVAVPAGGAPARTVKVMNGKSGVSGSSRDSRATKVRNGNSGVHGSSRDSRTPNISVAPITQRINLRDNYSNLNPLTHPTLPMNSDAPRPTRRFVFEWKPKKYTLRISKNVGEARQAQWVLLKHRAVGLAQRSVLLQAHSEESVKDHHSADPALIQPIMKGIDWRAGYDDGAPTHAINGIALSTTVPAGVGTKVSPNIDDGCFEVGESSGVSHHDESDESGSVRVNLADSESTMEVPLIMPAGLGPSSEIVAREAQVSGNFEGENPVSVLEICSVEDRDASSPLCCTPLARIDPIDCPIRFEVDIGASTGQPSQWVKKHYRGFCKLVGFPMETHEQECLDLLHRIEAERFQYKSPIRRKQTVGSVRKGSRELRNLVSTINYDGRPDDC
jgi:hypothetical protein